MDSRSSQSYPPRTHDNRKLREDGNIKPSSSSSDPSPRRARRRVLNPDAPISILVIGPSQNGKSAFINFIGSLSQKEFHPVGEGVRGNPCTTEVGFYDVEVPTSPYVMVDRKTGQEVDIPDIAVDEHAVLSGGWWRKQTSRDFALRLAQPDAPFVALRLIDTAGLDDNRGMDHENMEDVLKNLNRLSQSPRAWERSISAIVLVYNAHNPFSASFQDIIKHYYACMPNLFGGLAVVNTHYSLAIMDQKKTSLIRDKILASDKENGQRKILEQRARDFSDTLGKSFRPTHFFLDSKPRVKFTYTELLSCNTISRIIGLWQAAKPMPIMQMRLVKNRAMKAIDAKLQSGLQKARDRWTFQQEMVQRAVNEGEKSLAACQQTKEQLANSISRCQNELVRKDNDTEFAIQTYLTSDDPSLLKLAGTYIRRHGIRGSLTIKEPSYPGFRVSTEDNGRGRWTRTCYEGNGTWRGAYEGEIGKVPNLVARSYTTNRDRYHSEIAGLRREVRKLEASQAENDQELLQMKSQSLDGDPETSKQLEALGKQIEAANHLIEILKNDKPPIDEGFNDAARRRYRKGLEGIGIEDLLAFVEGVDLGFDLAETLQDVVSDMDMRRLRR